MSKSLRCSLNIHDVKNWQFIRSEQCDQIGTCSRCGERVKRLFAQHSWGEWKQNLGNQCLEERFCLRCGERNTKDTHTWGEFQYIAEGKCEVQKFCLICGEANQLDVAIRAVAGAVTETNLMASHSWGEWLYDQRSNRVIRVCKRCAEVEYKKQQAI
jgi:hypothetical protein